jgi:hypothetical protein
VRLISARFFTLTENGTRTIDARAIHAALRPWGTSRINRVLSTLERAGHIQYHCEDGQHHFTGWVLTP